MAKNQEGVAHVLLIALIVIVLAAVGFVGYKVMSSRPQPQPVLTTNFIELDKVDKISKFRSCQGHVVVSQDSGETTRNMKHYVVLKPEFEGGGKVSVYAPFDGVIKSLSGQRGPDLEGEIWLGNPNNDWDFSVQHIKVADNLKEGQKVSAGEELGTVANRGIDVVYGTMAHETKNVEGVELPYASLDSAFNHFDPKLVAEYQAHGINPADMSYSKEYRDQTPCKLEPNGPSKGQLNDHDHPEDWVTVR